ncbi:MAG: hypothetical protein KDA32_12920 [Phycisphaerales bacterium]|nr:hypothetical protein [Phycisphaerales bacterium]
MHDLLKDLRKYRIFAKTVARAFDIDETQFGRLRRLGPVKHCRGNDAWKRLVLEIRRDRAGLIWRLRNQFPAEYRVQQVADPEHHDGPSVPRDVPGEAVGAGARIDVMASREEAILVNQFLVRHAMHVSAKAMALRFGIGEGQLSRWRKTGPAKASRALVGWKRMVREIQLNPDRLIEACGGRLHEGTADPDALLQVAFQYARTDRVASALDTALTALESAYASRPSDAIQLIPAVLFLAHRHTLPNRLLDVLKSRIAPILANLPSKPSARDRLARRAALGQLGAILNEGGAHDLLADLAESGSLRSFTLTPRAFAWCGPYFMRIEAHRLAWQDHSIAHARDVAEFSGQIGDSAPSRRSTAFTLSEIHLACGQTQRSWEIVEEHYSQIRARLSGVNITPAGEIAQRLENFSGDVAIFLLAVRCKLQVYQTAYADFEEDLAYLEAALGLRNDSADPRRVVRLTYKAPVLPNSVSGPVRERFESVEALCRKPPLPSEMIRYVSSLGQKLVV